jgi:tetratricopeptide (TPR) repeat protein
MDLDSEAVQCKLASHSSLLRAVLSPDGNWAASSGWHTPSIFVWDARTGAAVKELRLGTMNNAFFSPDGRTLITSRGDEYCFWDIPSFLPVKRLPWDVPNYPGWVAFAPDQNLMALELSAAVIHLIDTASGRTIAKLQDPRTDRAQWLSFTPDGAQLVAIASYSRAVHVWDLRAIRRHLATMDLDWESPAYQPVPPASAAGALAVEALLGDLLPTQNAGDEKARRDIEKFRLALESQPDSANACNDLAWVYAIAPKHLRDPIRALALAQKATSLNPRDPIIRNTLGVAYYRAGRYREAADTLRTNLAHQHENYLATDLYFLAMSHHQLGETALARAYHAWADRLSSSQVDLPDELLQERAGFRAEAELLMGK